MRFKVITAAYNSPDYIERSLASIAAQDDPAFDVCVVDDASSSPRQVGIIRSYENKYGWKCIYNKEHRGVIYNHYHGINAMNPDPDDVIVWVDGDDRLAHSGVLSYLRKVYSDPDVLLTYGNYRPDPPSDTCPRPRPYSPKTIKNNDYRAAAYTEGLLYNHLRTMRFKVFNELDPDTDFKYKGEWMQVGGDNAIMIPALELVGPKHRCLDEVLYIYTSDNSISEWRRDPKLIDEVNAFIIRGLPKKARKW